MTTKEIIAAVIGAGGIGGLIAWLRGRKKDKADVRKTNAETELLLSEGAFKLVDRISIECDHYKDKVDRLILLVAETQTLLEKAKANHLTEVAELTRKLKLLESELCDLKEINCAENKIEAQRIMSGYTNLKKK